MSDTIVEYRKIRNSGNLLQVQQQLKDFIVINDDDAYEKIMWFLAIERTYGAKELLESHKWIDPKKELAAKAIIALNTLGDTSGISLAKEAFEKCENDADLIYKLPYIIALNRQDKVYDSFELIKNDIHKIDIGDALFSITIAEAAAGLKNLEVAQLFAYRSIAASPRNPRALRVLGICEFLIGEYHAAIGYATKAYTLLKIPQIASLVMACKTSLGDYYGAIATAKNHEDQLTPDMYEQLGIAYIALNNLAEAEKNYKRALEINNNSPLAVKGLLNIYSELRRHHDVLNVVNEYKSIVDTDFEASVALGYHYLNIGDRDTSFNYFRSATRLSAKNPTVDNRLEWPVSEPRLRHDFEQLRLLDKRKIRSESANKAFSVIKKYESKIGDISLKLNTEDVIERAELIELFGSYHSIPDLAFDGNALGENDYRKIEKDFLENKTKIVVIDNFLSEPALLNLRKFCEEATVWKRTYANGYHGSFMPTGFCSRVLLAIADELKIAMPKVVGPNILKQAWGFKYDQRMKGINLHADFAKVNTNFWITPDDANLDSEKGGIVVYDTPAPEHWSFLDYNAESDKIEAFLKANNAKAIRIPYRLNRCVLFDSTYFHATDEINFKDGYENRRINVTLLYGQGLRSR